MTGLHQCGYDMGVACHLAHRWDALTGLASDTTDYGVGFRAGWNAGGTK
jgi:hypothetical protein